MKITDDKIEFTTDDFAGFSEPVKRALSRYLEDYAAYFASSLNALVVAAKQHSKNLAVQVPIVNDVLDGYAAADEDKRAAAEPLLIELEEFLNS